MTTSTFMVRKDDLSRTEIRERADVPLASGQVRVSIERFALTSNNITYAAFGDSMHYWAFFPSGEDGWGVIPVWGFGNVMQSSQPGIAVGERLYGYFPMADSVVLQPTRISPAGFVDGTAHRAPLHAVYNQYLRCAADPLYSAGTEDVQALLRPLFITSWLIDDFLADNAFFGAAGDNHQPRLILSSASSKTAYGTAYALQQRGGVEVVGLTSSANLGFCDSLGCYDQVLAYEQLGELAADVPCVYVDFSGNAGLRLAIHTRFSKLLYSCSVGGTHVEQLGGAHDLPGPRASLFFAPAQIKKRHADWGREGFAQRLLLAWNGFAQKLADPVAPWITVQRAQGGAAVAAVYRQVLSGRGDPRAGHMVSLLSWGCSV